MDDFKNGFTDPKNFGAFEKRAPGRVFGDLWPATIFSFIMAEAHQVHQRDIRDDQTVTL